MTIKERFMKHKEENIPFVALILFCAIAFFCCLCCSCSSAKELPVVHDTISRVEVREIPVAIHDSVFHIEYVKEYVKGDTVYKDVIKYDKVYVETPVLIHDTVISTEVREIPVEVVKEKPARGFLWWLGVISFICIIALACLCVYLLIKTKSRLQE